MFADLRPAPPSSQYRNPPRRSMLGPFGPLAGSSQYPNAPRRLAIAARSDCV